MICEDREPRSMQVEAMDQASVPEFKRPGGNGLDSSDAKAWLQEGEGQEAAARSMGSVAAAEAANPGGQALDVATCRVDGADRKSPRIGASHGLRRRDVPQGGPGQVAGGLRESAAGCGCQAVRPRLRALGERPGDR
ncbi:hypothetical protein XAC3612_1250052 [Xanthomonas citri pv. citri]|nr:hypothetical protein XAC3612_1250052 [Xanthomonas citri pv. citri]